MLLTEEQCKEIAIQKALINKCEGACEVHLGECKAVKVDDKYDWGYFSYCENAIKKDLSNGFIVEEVRE